MAMPAIAILMPLGWATHFVVLRLILKGVKRIVLSRTSRLACLCECMRKYLKNKPVCLFYSNGITKIFNINILAGLMLCCVAAPVMINSTETVSNAVKKSGYPYRDGDIEWMDMGLWLARNASPDAITMTRNPWELHFYSEQLAIQIPRTTLEKTIEVMRYYKPTYIIPQLDIRPSLKPLVEGKVPGLELVYDNKKLQLYKIRYDLLPEL